MKVVSGPHEGSIFYLQPMKDRPCPVGSSSGLKFCDHGISLPNDEMISIDQGRFELNSGTAYYTDNEGGTKARQGGRELEGNVPLLLKEGMELVMGSGVLKISLVDDCGKENIQNL